MVPLIYTVRSNIRPPRVPCRFVLKLAPLLGMLMPPTFMRVGNETGIANDSEKALQGSDSGTRLGFQMGL